MSFPFPTPPSSTHLFSLTCSRPTHQDLVSLLWSPHLACLLSNSKRLPSELCVNPPQALRWSHRNRPKPRPALSDKKQALERSPEIWKTRRKPLDKLRHDSDVDYKRKRQLLSPDLDQHQIKLALCGAAPYRSNAKSPTVIVQKLGVNGHQYTPMAVAAKQGFVPLTYVEMAQRNKICHVQIKCDCKMLRGAALRRQGQR